jgi:hypothetical protein
MTPLESNLNLMTLPQRGHMFIVNVPLTPERPNPRGVVHFSSEKYMWYYQKSKNQTSHRSTSR